MTNMFSTGEFMIHTWTVSLFDFLVDFTSFICFGRTHNITPMVPGNPDLHNIIYRVSKHEGKQWMLSVVFDTRLLGRFVPIFYFNFYLWLYLWASSLYKTKTKKFADLIIFFAQFQTKIKNVWTQIFCNFEHL